MMTELEIAKIVFDTEVERGLHVGVSFEAWLASKEAASQEVEKTEEELMREWDSSNLTITVKKNENVLADSEITIDENGVRTLEVYTEHSGLKVGDIVSTGKRTKKITAIKVTQWQEQEPKLWFFTESKNGSWDKVNIKTVSKYKIVSRG